MTRTHGLWIVAWLAVACLLALPGGAASAAGASGWSVRWLPVPSSAVTTPLACSSSTACTALATDYPFPSSDRDVLYAARWNGQGWSRQVMPEPVGAVTVLAGGISCPSMASCFAVGGSTSGGRYVPLVERWNGAVWSVEPVPAPARAGLSSRFTSVSCTSATACTAVGESVSRSSKRPSSPLVERFDGTKWSIEHATGGTLIGVSCTSAHACTAVGDAGNQTLGERWNGRNWSIEPSPHPRPFGGPNGENQLNGVSCSSRDACIAVGDSTWGSDFGAVQITLAEHWNGSQWAVQTSPNPIQLDELKSVSCSSGSSCIAVGDYTNRAGASTLPLVERWRGGHWSALRAPRRLSTGKAADPTLVSVVCFARGSCIALGDAEGGPFAVQFRAG